MIKKVFKMRGFTLMEIVVAIGIFAITSLIVSAIFINANKLQQNTASYQRLQNDGRYIIEKVSREIRGRELILPRDEALNPTSILSFLEDEYGQTVQISYDSDTKNLNYVLNGVSEKLNADDVDIKDVKFYVLPVKDPFNSTDPIPNVQPRVTLLIKLENKSLNVNYTKQLILQTTISSKLYKR